jgi:biotin carboxyl carrier protein
MAVVKRYRVTVDGRVFEVEVEELAAVAQAEPAVPAPAPAVAAPAPAAHRRAHHPPAPPVTLPVAGAGDVTAPLPGLVSTVRVQSGQAVEEGQVLLILEAMKMENEIVAPKAGTVAEIAIRPGTTVAAGDLLIRLS